MERLAGLGRLGSRTIGLDIDRSALKAVQVATSVGANTLRHSPPPTEAGMAQAAVEAAAPVAATSWTARTPTATVPSTARTTRRAAALVAVVLAAAAILTQGAEASEAEATRARTAASPRAAENSRFPSKLLSAG
jgi:hypothetical protein